MNKLISVLTALLIPSLLLANGNLRELDAVVAVVGDSAILKSEVDEFVEMKVAASGGTADGLMRNMLFNESLEQLIDEKVLLVYAKNDTNIAMRSSSVDQQVNSRVASIMQQNKITEEQLAMALRQEQNMSLDEFRARLYMQIEQDMARQQLTQFYLAGAQLSREEVRQFFDEYKDSLPPVGESVRLQKMEIALRADSLLRQKAYESISSLYTRISEQGEDFGKLAKEFSSGPNASNGGDLGFISKGTFSIIRLEQAIFSLQPGEVSDPIETKLGFHIVKVVERRDSRVHALHILVPVTPSDEKVALTAAFLDSVKNAAPNSDDFVELIAEHSTDAVSRAYGGDTDWMLVESLDAAKKKALGELEVGSFSDVVTQDNTMYLFRISGYERNRILDLESDWTQIEQFARQITSQKRLSELVKEWRSKVFVAKYR